MRMCRVLICLLSLACAANTCFSQTVVYSNATGFTGSGLAVGASGTTAQGAVTITSMFSDNITMLPIAANQSITLVTFRVGNFSATAFSARPRIRFYADDNGGTAPGTFITGFSFNPISFPAATVSGFTFAPGVGQIVVPSNSRLWASILFDNSGATGTATDMQSLGVGIFGTYDVGSSTDAFFLSAAPASGSYLANNPAGSAQTVSPSGSFGWGFQIAAVPEPTTWALMGGAVLLGAVGVRRWRVKQSVALDAKLQV